MAGVMQDLVVCRRTIGCLIFGLLLGCGSGGDEIRATGTADDAQSVLTKTLEAWKSGATAESLKTSEDGTIVVDDDWKGGRKLTTFEATDPGIENGGHWRIPVKLTLDGSKTAVTAFYAVTPGKPASVIRSDFTE